MTEAEDGRGLVYWILFWTPAVGLIFLVGRLLFREQWSELKTLRFLRNGLGPFYPEFDPPNLTIWVNRCAPHVWQGWRLRSFDGLAGFATEGCLGAARERFAGMERAGQVFEGRLEKILRVHPLDLRLDGPGPAPVGVTLRLRVEAQASDAVRGPGGQLVSGRAELSQLQQFWTLRHDGRQWRLDSVVTAEGDLPRLPKAPPLPGLMDWKRPAPAGDEQGERT